MNLEHYRQRLLAVHQETSTRLERAVASVAELSDRAPHDTGDESSNAELTYQQLAEVEAARTLLSEVRDALDCIENGTFGRCAEDGGPIEEARLEAAAMALRTVTGMTGGEHQGRRDARADRKRRPDESACRLRHRVDILPVVPLTTFECSR